MGFKKTISLLFSTALTTSILFATTSSASVSVDQINSAYTKYTTARAQVLKEMSRRNRDELHDLKAAFDDANYALQSMEAFLAAYAIYRANLDHSATTAELVATLTLDLLSGKAVATNGVGVPHFSSHPGTGPVLSPEGSLASMGVSLDKIQMVYDRMRKAKATLLRDVSPDSSAVAALDVAMNTVSIMYYALADLRVLLKDKVDGIKYEISSTQAEAGRVFFSLDLAVAKLAEARQLIAQSQKILKDAAAGKVVPNRSTGSIRLGY